MTTELKTPPAPDLVTVSVNGVEMRLPKGKNLLQALVDGGHYVPHYCYHPSLSIAGNCRLCLVEIEGRPKPEISCNMTCSDGLKIKTDSVLVDDCRKGMMEFLLINHPLDCPICDRGGECMLQRYSFDYGWGTARTTDERRRFPKPQLDPLIDIERNRCIMCTRCVRFCDEVGGDHVMGVFGHGNANYIGTFGNGPVSNMFSGNVIDLCPVGCLTSKPFRFRARAWELRQTLTTTRHCNGAATAWIRGGKLLRVTPPVRLRNGLWTIDEDTTQFISNEARFGSMYANHGDRILYPLVRQHGRLVSSSWEMALGAAAEALRGAGDGRTAILAGERSTNEEAFLLSRLARAVLGTAALDWRSRFISAAAADAAGAAIAASDGDFDLLARKAYASTIVINSDFLGSAPDIALQLREAARLGQTKLALVGSRIDRWMTSQAQAAYLETPEALVAGIDQLASALAGARESAKAPEGFEALFELLKSEQGLLVLGLDNGGGALNAALVPAALRLLKALGAGWHFIGATAARNAKGVLAAGAQAGRVPGGAHASAAALEAAGNAWGAKLSATVSGAEADSAPALLRRAAKGEFQTLFLHRTDELTTHVQRELVEQAIKATPNIIVLDIFPSWITEYATVVLPGALFYETDGSMTDIDGTIQRMTLGCKPAGEAQEDWRIIESLCNVLGATKRYRKAQDIFGELTELLGAGSALRLDDLRLEGPGIEAPQVHKRNAIGQRTRPDFKIAFGERDAAAALKSPAAAPPPAGLRLLWVHHSHGEDHLGSRSTVFKALRPQPNIELSPEDAQKLGLREGDWVVIEGGSDTPSQVTLNAYVAPGIAFGAANVLGLRLAADAETLPQIRLRKTVAPPTEGMPNAAPASPGFDAEVQEVGV